MKALVISPTFPPMRSGGADFAFRQCELLAERGVDVHVITSRSNEVARPGRFQVSALVRDWSWRDLRQIVRIARRFRPDVVQIHFAGGLYKHQAMVTFLPSILKRWVRVPRVVLHVEYPHPIAYAPQTILGRAAHKLASVYRWHRKLEAGYATLLRESDVVFVLCEPHRALLEQHEPGMKRKCVIMGSPPAITFYEGGAADARAQSRAELGLAPDERLLVYYGYLYPDKGLETLLEAFQLLVQANGHAHLLILGGPNEMILPGEEGHRYAEELKERAERLGLGERIIWTGYFPKESDRPSRFLYAADMCVLPFYDGLLMHRSTFGVAAAHGLPIVSTRGAVVENVFVDGANVLLCAPRDPNALAATIQRLMGDPALQEQLGRGAKKLADEHLSWERCIEQTLQAFAGTSEINRFR